MGAFIVHAPAFDDTGVLIRPVGQHGSWGVSGQQLEHLLRYCEGLGIARDAWPDCTRGRLSARQIKDKCQWLDTRLTMTDDRRVRSFVLDSGEPLLALIRDALRDGQMIAITH
jgi:hypothetical protein